MFLLPCIGSLVHLGNRRVPHRGTPWRANEDRKATDIKIIIKPIILDFVSLILRSLRLINFCIVG